MSTATDKAIPTISEVKSLVEQRSLYMKLELNNDTLLQNVNIQSNNISSSYPLHVDLSVIMKADDAYFSLPIISFGYDHIGSSYGNEETSKSLILVGGYNNEYPIIITDEYLGELLVNKYTAYFSSTNRFNIKLSCKFASKTGLQDAYIHAMITQLKCESMYMNKPV